MDDFYDEDLLADEAGDINEADYIRIRRDNEAVIQKFGKSLKKKDYAEKDIYRLLSMADMYVNSYLLDNLSLSAAEGTQTLDDYFMEYFPENVIWASSDSVDNMITAIKAFYRYLLEHGVIEREDFVSMSELIKEKRELWRQAAKMPVLPDPDEDEIDLGGTL